MNSSTIVINITAKVGLFQEMQHHLLNFVNLISKKHQKYDQEPIIKCFKHELIPNIKMFLSIYLFNAYMYLQSADNLSC
jgi:hypothetical protein